MSDKHTRVNTRRTPPHTDESTLDEVVGEARSSERSASLLDVMQTVVDEKPDAGTPEVLDAISGQRVTLAPREGVEITDGFDRPGRATIERYDIDGRIGEGGMGDVMRVRDGNLRRHVALKTLKPGLHSDAVRARFIREAQITAQLDHPNIVPLYNIIDDRKGGLAFTMKLVDGDTLSELLHQARERFEKAPDQARSDEDNARRARIEVLIKVCDAMAFAHSHDVIHRDLSPDNIMLGAFGEVYVMDWGMARVLDLDEVVAPTMSSSTSLPKATRAGELPGTPVYMSPEQVSASDLDARSDVYTMGLILFELATLRIAKPGRTAHEMMFNTASGKLNEMVHLHPEVTLPKDLIAVVERALRTHPAERYDSAHALADDLRRLLRGDMVSARPDTQLRATMRWLSQHRGVTLGAMLALLLAASLLTTWSVVKANRAVTAQRDTVTRASARQRQLNALLSHVTTRAHQLDTRLMQLAADTTHLARQTSVLLQHPGMKASALPPASAFDASATLPSSAQFSTLYNKVISLETPAYVIAPDADQRQTSTEVARLAALKHTLTHVYHANAHASDVDPAAPPLLRHKGLHQGAAIRWAFVGLASGVLVSFPGKGGYPRSYDPRTRPWYALGERAREPRWGNPYVDLQGQGLLLPCVAAILNARGEHVGVAAIEVTFTELIKHHLQASDAPAFEQAFLVDAEGRVVVQTDVLLDSERDTGALHDARRLEPFFEPALMDASRANPSGVIETTLNGRPVLLGYQKLSVLGWVFVEAFHPTGVLAPD